MRDGGGLVVLGETEQEKYGNNLNELLGTFRAAPGERHRPGLRAPSRRAPSWILAALQDGGRGRSGDLLARVKQACLYRTTTVSSTNGARVLARTYPTASTARRTADRRRRATATAGSSCSATPTCSATTASASSTTARCGSTSCIGSRARRRPRTPRADRGPGGRSGVDRASRRGERAGAAPGPRRLARRRRRRERRGRPRGADRSRRSRHSRRTSRTTASTSPPSSRTSRAWRDGGYAKPDFTRSLDVFRPDQQRIDGVEHLVVFPMYKQNGSRDTCFEALLVRVPWPDWIAELERTRYDNKAYRPGRADRLQRRVPQRVRGSVPGDGVGGGSPAEPLRRDLL